MSVELSNITFSYPQQKHRIILDIPSWSIATGERVFIHGPSGSGKSTLLNLISGLMLPNIGHIKVLGQTINQMSGRQRDRFRADNIGYVFQQFNLIPYLNAVDNIKLSNHFSKQNRSTSLDREIKALLEYLNITDKDWKLPTRNLSIGQQQRVAIARSLINKPGILIADEPTSSLDAENREKYMNLLLSVADENEMTMLFVSHDLSLSHNFKRVESLKQINQQMVTESC